MRVLALGGCGEMGRHAVKTLLTYDFIRQIIIADVNEESAIRFAEECGLCASSIGLDISDTKSLEHALEDVDLVMNTVGPYYRFGVQVLSACIQRGCHYLDINDDWEPTLDMLQLNEQARKAEITAVIGIGASPGISSMLAVKAMAELDTAEEIFTGWDLDSAKPGKIGKTPSAATIHGIHQLTGLIRAYQDGKYMDIKPVKKVKLNYPGIGECPAWTIGHPEAVTLPRYFTSLRQSSNVMTTSGFNIFGIRILSWFVNKGIISVNTAARFAERIEGAADPDRTPERLLGDIVSGRVAGLPPLFALAKGKKNGKSAAAGCMILSAPEGGMGGVTGVPLAVCAFLLGRNRINRHGVFAPEGVLDPDDFFNALAPLCSPKKTGADDLVLKTRSWEEKNVIDLLKGS